MGAVQRRRTDQVDLARVRLLCGWRKRRQVDGPLSRAIGDGFQFGDLVFGGGGSPDVGVAGGRMVLFSAATMSASLARSAAAGSCRSRAILAEARRYRKTTFRNGLRCVTCGSAAARSAATSGILASPPARITSARRSSVVPVVPDLPIGLLGFAEPPVAGQAAAELLHRRRGLQIGRVLSDHAPE